MHNESSLKLCYAAPDAPDEVSIVSVMTGSESFTVTIEWTPHADATGEEHNVTATPAPISPPLPVTITPDTTAPRQINITVNYNTNYTVTVGVQSCDGPREAATTVFRGMSYIINTMCYA